MILLDTSGLLAWIDADQRRHAEVVATMASATPPYLLSPFVLAELDASSYGRPTGRPPLTRAIR